MPVLSEHHVLEPLGKPVNERHHFVSVRDCEGSFRTEIILHIDHD
jgi:hypothetical protein